jgi:hypothetical protein
MTAVAAMVLLVVPRIFLIALEDSGVRVEDVILIVLAPYAAALLSRKRLGMKRVVDALKLHYAVVTLAAIAATIAGHMGLLAGLAYGLRPALSVAAFYLGYQLGLFGTAGRWGVLRIATAAVAIHIVYGAGVAVDLFPNVASFTPTRLAGLTNGPYELSAMLCLVCVLWLWCGRWAITAGGFAALLWTKSRIALAALPVYLLFRGGSRRTVIRWAFPVAAIVIATTVIEARSGGVELGETLDAVSDLREAFATSAQTRDDYFTAVYSDEANANIKAIDGDPSALLRAARWSMVIATAIDTPRNLVFGMGPGYYSVALDGNYVRLLGESGLLGIFTFLFMLASAATCFKAPELRRLGLGLAVQLLIIALFIDVFMSLKTMCLFWMIIGALKREEANRFEPRPD